MRGAIQIRRPASMSFPVVGRSGYARILTGAFLLGLSLPPAANAQPLTERTPNLAGTWISSPRVLHFQFAHRFQTTGDGSDISDIFGDAKIVNYPTFELSYGLFAGALASVRYSSNSVIASGFNEWQLGLKYAPVRNVADGRISLSVLGAWNTTNESLDGELAAETRLGRLFFSGALRGFTNMLDLEAGREEALAAAGGLGLKLNRYVTLAGDVGGVVAGAEAVRDRTDVAWSAGLHLGIPFTPHTLSIMATNVTSGTLQGVSTGVGGEVFWGFELTVPFSGFARWGKILNPDEIQPQAAQAMEAGDTPVVEVGIREFAYQRSRLEIPAGTTVRWINRDPVGHTSTSDDGVWSSPLIGPGETFEYRFDEAGEYAYHCVPHPFMKATIVVRD